MPTPPPPPPPRTRGTQTYVAVGIGSAVLLLMAVLAAGQRSKRSTRSKRGHAAGDETTFVGSFDNHGDEEACQIVVGASDYPPVPVISNAAYVNMIPPAKRARINDAAAAAAVDAVMDLKMDPSSGDDGYISVKAKHWPTATFDPALEFPQEFNPRAHRSADGGHGGHGGSCVPYASQSEADSPYSYMSHSGGSSPLGPESPGVELSRLSSVGRGNGNGKGKGKQRSPRPCAPYGNFDITMIIPLISRLCTYASTRAPRNMLY